MKRNKILITGALLLAICLSACSAGGSTGSPPMPAPEVNGAPEAWAQAPEGGFQDFGAAEEAETPAPSLAPQESAREGAKLIQEAWLTVETTDFQSAVQTLDALTGRCGGYYERAQVQGGGLSDTDVRRYGSYVIRVPSGRFEDFLSGAGGVGHVVDTEKKSTDVGEAYADTEARLRAQEIKRDRLLALLEKAATMEDIIELENALSEVEYQIEGLSGTLRKYDALVDYATISVELSEVRKLTDNPVETDSLGVRLGHAFSGGLERFGERVGNFAVWCAYHFVGLLIFAALAAAGVIAAVRVRRKRRGPPPPPPAEPPKEGK